MFRSSAAPDSTRARLGATYLGESKCSFLVWAPKVDRVEVHLMSPRDEYYPLAPAGRGYFHADIQPVEPGARYRFRLNGTQEFPDPASRFQPEGVHGPSEIVPDQFAWSDSNWNGLPLSEYVIYELHVGTFTPAGSFEAIIGRLDYLKDLGVTAIEIMPVAQFPGSRNWGYDGVYPFAAQNSYGGPLGLKKLVNAAHHKEIAVVLDVVYNHLGPEGNYLPQFGFYMTDRYVTPWGKAVNFDGEHSSEVRRYVVENALQWTTEFHIDALRLDAIHTIFDASELHILREISETVHQHAGQKQIQVIAESNLNDVRVIQSTDNGGLGLDAQWNDDFHHSLHALLTGEQTGYYQDFGNLRHLTKTYREGFVYTGEFSRYRDRLHGTPSRHIAADRFVVFSQNHDQIGNRMLGERLSTLLTLEQTKLAAAAVILSPFVPMLFMGEEYAENAPFLYFVSHSDVLLIEAVRKGRRAEFADFGWEDEAPDPQSVATFERSRLQPEMRTLPQHREIFEFYRELLRLRSELAPLRNLSKKDCEVICMEEPAVIAVRRWHGGHESLMTLHFGFKTAAIELPFSKGVWTNMLESSASKWLGPGSTIPDEIHSSGKMTLSLSAQSVCLLSKAAP